MADTAGLSTGADFSLLQMMQGLSGKSGKGANAAKIKETSQDFESMFITEMLNNMNGESEQDPLAGDPETNDIYKSMLNTEYGKIIARAGGIGVADYVAHTMLQHQEIKS